ncbi:hypothetical protein EYW49_22420 [Siculibacillus lacustris]|uniref:VPLPA-CTERM sorting domain-containing protein n=1 Tax=Siculibacillus lacustris TaxID=1549641 RepID=A0A4Q9VCP2_9HYPH|nr:hypothetical protein [Siculibacillus lacustris]TBW32229.1 hypothetical protein EYW49_22420 [Siculibacillus lacustris]
MKKLLGAVALSVMLLSGGGANATPDPLAALELTGYGGGYYTTAITDYTVFLSAFGGIYNGGVGYSNLATLSDSLIYDITGNSFDALVTVGNLGTKSITVDVYAYNVFNPATGTPGINPVVTYSTPGPIAGAGLPILVVLGAVGFAMRRRNAGASI